MSVLGTRKVIAATVLCLATAGLSAAGHATETDLVAKGKYLANAAGCAACHTAEAGQPFAGGHVLKTPFGDLAVPNITQDQPTGIGNWTAEDFEGALRRGIGKDGLPLYPAMPYVHYTKISDDDIDALWAFIRTVEPVAHRVEVNLLPFPFDVRESLAVWQMLYLQEGRFEADSGKSPEWNRGAYLVDALAHCAACHTPRDALGGPIGDRALQGAPVEEWYAPDISNGPGSVIGDWSVERLTGYLEGESGNNHVALGSMRDVVDDISRMTKDDRTAIAVYLKDQPASSDADTAAAGATALDTVSVERGGRIFSLNCANCHAADGKGKEGIAASLVGAGGVVAASPANVISVLLQGISPGTGPFAADGLMPSFRDVLDSQEIADVANYVRASWGNDAPLAASSADVNHLRRMSETDPTVAAGTTCPNAPAAKIDEGTRSAITALAQQATVDPNRIADIVAGYSEHFPDTTRDDRVLWLAGLYCQQVAIAGAPKAEVIERQLRFMNAVAAVPAKS